VKKKETFIDKLAAQLKEWVEIDEQKAMSDNGSSEVKHHFLKDLKY